MSHVKWFAALAVLVALGLAAPAAEKAGPKRLLLVTDSAGFIHDALGVAEEIMKEVGPKYGFQVTCYRFIRDPKAKAGNGKTALEEYAPRFKQSTGVNVGPENCGRINKDTLKKFDVVVFYTTGTILNEEELKDLVDWVKAGGGFAGVHSGTDTLYGDPAYGELVGGYFNGHPWHQKVKLHLNDPRHPAAKGFKEGDEITDEIYTFRAPYSRQRLHLIMTLDNNSIDLTKGNRKDNDYAVAWCQQVGKGRSFYHSLGHLKEVWKDPRFQTSLFNGLKWVAGQLPGDATPSGK